MTVVLIFVQFDHLRHAQSPVKDPKWHGAIHKNILQLKTNGIFEKNPPQTTD